MPMKINEAKQVFKDDVIDKKHCKFDKDDNGKVVSCRWTTLPLMCSADIKDSLQKGMHVHGIGNLVGSDLADAYQQVDTIKHTFRPDINIIYNVKRHTSHKLPYVTVDFGTMWAGKIPQLSQRLWHDWTHLDIYPNVWAYMERREHYWNNMWLPKAIAQNKTITKRLPDNQNILTYTIACWARKARGDYRSGRKDLYNKYTMDFSLNQYARAKHLMFGKILKLAEWFEKQGYVHIIRNNGQCLLEMGPKMKQEIYQQVLPVIQKAKGLY